MLVNIRKFVSVKTGQDYRQIYNHSKKLMNECDEIIEKNKHKASMPGLPQVPDLNVTVKSFFTEGKKFFKEAFSLLECFYQLEKPIGVQFDKAFKILEKVPEVDQQLVKMLEVNGEWIKFFSACRNAIEHEKDGQKIVIRNFTFCPGNKFSLPSWKYDLTKAKLGVQEEFSDLVTDLDWFLNNMFLFFESLYLLCIKDNWANKRLYVLYQVEDKKIDPNCPIKYRVTLDLSKLKPVPDES